MPLPRPSQPAAAWSSDSRHGAPESLLPNRRGQFRVLLVVRDPQPGLSTGPSSDMLCASGSTTFHAIHDCQPWRRCPLRSRSDCFRHASMNGWGSSLSMVSCSTIAWDFFSVCRYSRTLSCVSTRRFACLVHANNRRPQARTVAHARLPCPRPRGCTVGVAAPRGRRVLVPEFHPHSRLRSPLAFCVLGLIPHVPVIALQIRYLQLVI